MKRLKLYILCLLITICAVTSAQSQTTNTTTLDSVVPNLVKFSGTASDLNGKPMSGMVGINLALYKDQQGGAPLWLETQNVSSDKAGHFTVSLGASKTEGLPAELFTSGQARWLGVQPQGQPEQPRVLLMSVPYALKAGDAETLGGKPASAFISVANVGPTGHGALPPGTITGTGSANFVPLFTGTTTIGNSKIFQNVAGSVGIATTAPAAKLDVKGTGDFRDTLTLFPKSAHPALSVSGTAFQVSNGGTITFVSGQTFPGTGTITGVTAGADLTGGGTTGKVTLNLDTTKVPLLASANNFNASQTVNGNLSLGGSGNGVIFADGTKQTTAAKGGGGTVTSVALSAPNSDFTVSGSPITTSGTLGLGWTVAPTSANTANAIVKRDGAGNFNGNTVIASAVNATNLTATGTVQGGVGNFGGGVLASTTTDADYAVGILGEQLAVTRAGVGVEGYGNSLLGVGMYGNAYSQSNEGAKAGASFPTGVWGDTSLFGGVGVFGSVDDAAAADFVNDSSIYDTVDLINDDPTSTGSVLVGWGNGVPTSILDMNGNLSLQGNISKAGGSFKIDHPLDPANKYLYHSFVESPDMMNIYNGVVVLDDAGQATVILPEWFEALNRDFRYQLTAIGAPGPNLYIADEVANNRFKIAGGKAGSRVSWQVTGVRHDVWADAHRIPLEVEKTGDDKGKYLHPELFGLGRDKSSIHGRVKPHRRITADK
jgi:hypothetical protein